MVSCSICLAGDDVIINMNLYQYLQENTTLFEIRKKVSQLILGIKNQVENLNKNKNGTIFVFGAKIVIDSF